MYLDAVDIRDFYANRLGKLTRARLGTKIRHVWPDVKGDRLLGLGYPTPYLRPYLETAERVLALMPAEQGVFNWPPDKPSVTSLVSDYNLPLPDASIDRVLLIHSLEMTDSPRDLLSEVWRVLSPGGRLLVVVPNRAGLWVRIETTPFGYGRPFSRGQLTDLMRETDFSPVGWVSALYTPPIIRRSVLTSNAIESLGERFFSPLSGVFLMEATKQLFQGLPTRKKRAFAPRFSPGILVPAPQPSPIIAPSPISSPSGSALKNEAK